ncbi:hypothetical protein K456DRAFT_55356 [Colletotrichum gloeosporioides 23]|nr:hypothetical protein K456DRAFT_55356 [Colletotrichum gloeosporioides 23]
MGNDSDSAYLLFFLSQFHAPTCVAYASVAPPHSRQARAHHTGALFTAAQKLVLRDLYVVGHPSWEYGSQRRLPT